MKTVGIREAQTHFHALAREVERGETVIITNRGKPVARMIPLDESPAAGPSETVGKSYP